MVTAAPVLDETAVLAGLDLIPRIVLHLIDRDRTRLATTSLDGTVMGEITFQVTTAGTMHLVVDEEDEPVLPPLPPVTVAVGATVTLRPGQSGGAWRVSRV